MRSGEVATLFNVSIRTIGRWAEAGKLPGRRTFGGQWQFNRSVIEQLAKERK